METIITVSIISIIALIATSFLMTFLSGSGKAEVSMQVRQNGNWALSVMEGMILNSRSAVCSEDGKSFTVTDLNEAVTTFSCQDTGDETKIASVSATSVDLTGSNVEISGCQFTCEEVAGKPTKVKIEFTVRQKGAENKRPGEKSSLQFTTEVVLRNF